MTWIHLSMDSQAAVMFSAHSLFLGDRNAEGLGGHGFGAALGTITVTQKGALLPEAIGSPISRPRQ